LSENRKYVYCKANFRNKLSAGKNPLIKKGAKNSMIFTALGISEDQDQTGKYLL